MSLFIFGLVLFFVPHVFSALRSRVEGRDIRKRWGESRYMGLYSLISLIGLGLIIWGYIQAPVGEYLYSGPHELRHWSWVFMVPAFIILVSAYMPLGYIKRTVKHPMMMGVFIWSGFHLALGGDLKHVLLFGSFAAYSLLSLICAYRRGTDLKARPAQIRGDIFSVIIGLILVGALIHGGHAFLFGVSPI